ncbi:hypothetical protein RHMOL_Rhmol08G0036600 [Rhododendron molle]|uniref:Uncharacterized protein n=1 Tax=Rhododendron molle TaxID=49168 RepID=A0ACC0MKI7_RHOML|nr:hypothetical protein RHMOL_Rhmol08G0036600 [Rhododendron molle]
MHRLAVKSNLVDTGQEPYKYGFQGSSSPAGDRPVCPKPRRLGSAAPEFLKPLKCNKHRQLTNENWYAPDARPLATRVLLPEEPATLWFTTSSSPIRWSSSSLLREQTCRINSVSPLPL